MILKIYSVWDSKAAAYIQPFFATNDAVATRMFETAANDAGHDFHRYAEDYALFRIGQFDQEKGDLLPENIVSIAQAHLLKAKHAATMFGEIEGKI